MACLGCAFDKCPASGCWFGYKLHTSILLRAGFVTRNRVPPAPIGSQVGGETGFFLSIQTTRQSEVRQHSAVISALLHQRLK